MQKGAGAGLEHESENHAAAGAGGGEGLVPADSLPPGLDSRYVRMTFAHTGQSRGHRFGKERWCVLFGLET